MPGVDKSGPHHPNSVLSPRAKSTSLHSPSPPCLCHLLLPPTPAIPLSLISSFHKSPFRHVASAPPAPLSSSSSFTLSPPFCNRGRAALIICRPSAAPTVPPTLIHFPAAPLLIYHASFFFFSLFFLRRRRRRRVSSSQDAPSPPPFLGSYLLILPSVSIRADCCHFRPVRPCISLSFWSLPTLPPGTWFPLFPSIHLPPSLSLPGEADRTAARRRRGGRR